MKQIAVFVFAIFTPTIIFSAAAFACKSCITCVTQCRGYYGCYPSCIPDCDECGSVLTKPYAEQLEPGLSLKQQDGYLTVMAVLRDAPASNSGIQVGDRLLSVNGKAIGFGWACDKGWEYEHSGKSRLTVQRGRTEFDVTVALRPVESLLASRWRATAILKEVKSVERKTKPSTLPYTFGVQLQQSGAGRAFVANILAGSPADEAGVLIGDEIAFINGVASNQAGARIEHLAAGTDYRVVIELGLVHNGANRIVRLQARGISEILAYSEAVQRAPSLTAPIAKLSLEQR